jgi:hypothetical protein
VQQWILGSLFVKFVSPIGPTGKERRLRPESCWPDKRQLQDFFFAGASLRNKLKKTVMAITAAA